MPVEIYQADNQLIALKAVFDTNTVKTDLSIPLIVPDIYGNSTGITNDSGVVIQSPYYLMDNYLPQIIIELQEEDVTDEQFADAETWTLYHIYYAMKFEETDPYVSTMYNRLRYMARKLMEFRTCQDYWYTATLPKIEVNNEVNEFYAQKNIQIAVGRIVTTLKDKRAWR